MHAIGAVAMALWDLRGQAQGKPVCDLLGPLRDTPVVAYASLQLVDGTIARPTRPGLGVELNWDALNAYKVA